jgi:hypothetical protein
MLSKFKRYKNIIFVAIFVRILLMPFFFHPDIKTYNFQASHLKEGVFDIYKYIDINRQTLPLKESFVYFPLTYVFLGGYDYLIDPLLGEGLDSWLSSGINISAMPQAYSYIFFLKIPYLVLDILIAYLLTTLVKTEDDKKRILYLWLFNPFTLLIINVYSNVDVLPVFMTVLSLSFLKKNNSFWAGISLAIGALFKVYPILLLPALLMTKESLKKQLIGVISSISLFVLVLLPFWSKSFIDAALSSGLTNRLFDLGINVGLPRKIPYYLIIYAAGFVYLYIKERNEIWKVFLVATLMLVAMVDFHIQWLLWFTPFLAVLVTRHTKYTAPVFLLMLFGVSVPLLVHDRYLTSGVYRLISPFFNQVTYPYLILAKYINPTQVRNTLGVIFMGTAFLISVLTILYDKN